MGSTIASTFNLKWNVISDCANTLNNLKLCLAQIWGIARPFRRALKPLTGRGGNSEFPRHLWQKAHNGAPTSREKAAACAPAGPARLGALPRRRVRRVFRRLAPAQPHVSEEWKTVARRDLGSVAGHRETWRGASPTGPAPPARSRRRSVPQDGLRHGSGETARSCRALPGEPV